MTDKEAAKKAAGQAWREAEEASRQAALAFQETMDAAIAGHVPLQAVVAPYQQWMQARAVLKEAIRNVQQYMESR